jgi:uncharacterized membrane protein YdjX (TVP38/TMEM64 family)
LKKKRNRTFALNFIAFICFVLALALIILLRVFNHESFIRWYSKYVDTLASYEEWMLTYGATLTSVILILINFFLKAAIPWFPLACICVASGVLFEWYYALLINLAGMVILFTAKFYWGRRFGGGNAEKILSKYETVYEFIDKSRLGSGAVLYFLRLVPCMPVNSVSSLYGSTDIQYWRYIIISVIGYGYKLFSYTLIGRSVYNPASASFIVPLILLLIFSGMMLLSLSGALELTNMINKLFFRKVGKDDKFQ